VLHAVMLCVASMTGVGFTLTTTVKGLPVQVPDVGVTVYVAVCVTDVVLVILSFNVDCPDAAVPEESPELTLGKDHAYLIGSGEPGIVLPVGA